MRSDRTSVPLYVDLDGTLLRGDSLHEGLARIVGQPSAWLPCLAALFTGGKAAFKKAVSLRAHLDPRVLPYRVELVRWINQEKASGRKVYLATGADSSIAQNVSDYLKLDGFLASDGNVNLTGPEKLKAIRDHSNSQPFAYAGNDYVDLPIWDAADHVILTQNGTHYASRYMSKNIDASFPDRVNRPASFLRLLRPHQWAKNILVFLPALAAHKLGDPAVLKACLQLFAAFSLCASGVYVANDILDIASDRQHPHKRNRPLASGAVTLPPALGLALLLPIGALALGSSLGKEAFMMVGAYWAASTFYSFRGKKLPVFDVFMLAGLYAFRAFAGGLTVPAGISSWMVAFLLFIFLSLACAKRYSELLGLASDHQGNVIGRGYRREDAILIAIFGISAAFASTLVVCLYAGSPSIVTLYPHPNYLLGVGPLVLFGLSRFWLLAWRGELHSDPVLHALRDPIAYGLLLAAVGFAYLAYLP
jgi:4-hydroxybenzoate polyprenyltransferase